MWFDVGRGMVVRVFGEPMSFWEHNMPTGMFLRSNWTATQIADPNSRLTLENYFETYLQESNSGEIWMGLPARSPIFTWMSP